MGKLILGSILVATVVAPMMGAADPLPRRGLGRCLLYLTLFIVAWLAVLVLVFAEHFKPELW